MHPGPDPLGASSSFSARRPNASNLPNFELPPPSFNPIINKFPPFATASQSPPVPGAIASVGNLITPPSNLPGDGLSPVSSGVASTSSNSTNVPPYTPTGYLYSPGGQAANHYGFHSGSNGGAQSYAPPRGVFSPPLQLALRGDPNSLNASKGLPPPPYDLSLPPFPTSGSMSAPSSAVSTMPGQHQQLSGVMMNGQGAVSSSAPQQSPVHAQDGFPGPRPPPTPTYYSHPSSTPQQPAFPYSAGPSPSQQSPISAGGSMSRMSPSNGNGPISAIRPPSQSPHPYQRPFGTYPLPGPVLSNVQNPNGQLALVGAMQHGMMPGFNSGHAATMGHLYAGHHPQQQNNTNDRPFKCDQCPQSFNRNHDLKRHKRIHLAVKPFPCGHCDKSFSRKDALKVSEERHPLTPH